MFISHCPLFKWNGLLLSGQIKSFCISTRGLMSVLYRGACKNLLNSSDPEGRDHVWTAQEHTGLAQKHQAAGEDLFFQGICWILGAAP